MSNENLPLLPDPWAQSVTSPVVNYYTAEQMQAYARAALAQSEQRKPGECWPKSVMQQWDYWRKQIANGDASSAPRDWFESLAPQSEQRQEAVAIVEGEHVMVGEEVWFAARCTAEKIPVGTKLYTSPQPREWVSLTHKELHEIYNYAGGSGESRTVAEMVESLLRKKNVGNV